VFSLFGAPLQALLPVFADDVFHRGARGFGLLAAVMGGGSVVGALFLGRRGRVTRRMIGLGLGFSGASMIAFASVPWFVAAVPLAFVFGGAYLFTISAVNGQIQTTVDDAVRGRVVSLLMMVFGGVFPVGSLIGGAVADRLGAPATTIGGAVVVAAFGAWLMWQARRRGMHETPEGVKVEEESPSLASVGRSDGAS
jgi:predicted MFS family arabinose efflux permease